MFGWLFKNHRTPRENIDIDEVIKRMSADVEIPMPEIKSAKNDKLDEVIKILNRIEKKL